MEVKQKASKQKARKHNFHPVPGPGVRIPIGGVIYELIQFDGSAWLAKTLHGSLYRIEWTRQSGYGVPSEARNE